MSEENTDIPTVAEVEYIKDTNGRIGVIGSIIPKISYEELVEKDELIRLSDHEQAMEEQREEVLEVIEDFSVFDLISDKLDAGGDPAFISWEKIDERVRQDLKQKLKSEVREDV